LIFNAGLRFRANAEASIGIESFLLYHEGFTFDSNNPSELMKVPNRIAASRVGAAILQWCRWISIEHLKMGDISEALKLHPTHAMVSFRDSTRTKRCIQAISPTPQERTF
jgi:hypothetical protein